MQRHLGTDRVHQRVEALEQSVRRPGACQQLTEARQIALDDLVVGHDVAEQLVFNRLVGARALLVHPARDGVGVVVEAEILIVDDPAPFAVVVGGAVAARAHVLIGGIHHERHVVEIVVHIDARLDIGDVLVGRVGMILDPLEQIDIIGIAAVLHQIVLLDQIDVLRALPALEIADRVGRYALADVVHAVELAVDIHHAHLRRLIHDLRVGGQRIDERIADERARAVLSAAAQQEGAVVLVIPPGDQIAGKDVVLVIAAAPQHAEGLYIQPPRRVAVERQPAAVRGLYHRAVGVVHLHIGGALPRFERVGHDAGGVVVQIGRIGHQRHDAQIVTEAEEIRLGRDVGIDAAASGRHGAHHRVGRYGERPAVDCRGRCGRCGIERVEDQRVGIGGDFHRHRLAGAVQPALRREHRLGAALAQPAVAVVFAHSGGGEVEKAVLAVYAPAGDVAVLLHGGQAVDNGALGRGQRDRFVAAELERNLIVAVAVCAGNLVAAGHDHQIAARFETYARGELPLARLGGIVGQPPALERYGVARGVADLDPVVGVAPVHGGCVGEADLVDHKAARVLLIERGGEACGAFARVGQVRRGRAGGRPRVVYAGERLIGGQRLVDGAVDQLAAGIVEIRALAVAQAERGVRAAFADSVQMDGEIAVRGDGQPVQCVFVGLQFVIGERIAVEQQLAARGVVQLDVIALAAVGERVGGVVGHQLAQAQRLAVNGDRFLNRRAAVYAGGWLVTFDIIAAVGARP